MVFHIMFSIVAPKPINFEVNYQISIALTDNEIHGYSNFHRFFQWI